MNAGRRDSQGSCRASEKGERSEGRGAAMGGDGFSGPNRAGRRQPPAVSISVRHPVIHDEGLMALVSFGYAKTRVTREDRRRQIDCIDKINPFHRDFR
jgi:hypothetical protein